MNIKVALRRVARIIRYRHWIFATCGSNNHFSKGCIIYERTVIGHDNYFAPYVMSNNTIIGNYCSIGPGVKLGLGEHEWRMISTLPKIGNGDGNMSIFDSSNPTRIENDVWIGANAVVMQGIKVCNGAVIGAGAVVTKDVAPYSIVIGSPAKHIKYRFTEEEVKRLVESEWYLKDIDEAKEIVTRIKKEMEKA